MLNMTKLLCALFLLCVTSTSLRAEWLEFNSTALEEQKLQLEGQQWMLLLWSVDCPPCFKELKLVKRLHETLSEKRNNKSETLPVMLVNVDEIDAEHERREIISEMGLNSFSHYYFPEGQNQRGRFLIDPTWSGELPRSYFIDSKGRFHGRSGLVKQALLEKWLMNTKPNSSAE